MGLPTGAVEIRWSTGLDSGVWDIEISTTPDMQNIIDSGTTSQIQSTPQGPQAVYSFTGAQDETTYYWRVRDALPNQFGETKSWRDLYTFNVSFGAPTPLSPTGPADTVTGEWHPWGLGFMWEHADRAEQYHIQIWERDSVACPDPTSTLLDKRGLPILGSPVPGDPLTYTFHLPVKAELCWRVRGETSDGEGNFTSSPWSNSFAFDTSLPKVEPISPIGGAVVDPWALTFHYDAPPFSEEVRVEVGPSWGPGEGIEDRCSSPIAFDLKVDPMATFSLENHCLAGNQSSPSGSLHFPITPRWTTGGTGYYAPGSLNLPYPQEYRFRVWGPKIGWAPTVDPGRGEEGAVSGIESFQQDGHSKFTPITGLYANSDYDVIPSLGTYNGMTTAAPILDYGQFLNAPESSTVTATWNAVPGAEGYVLLTRWFSDGETFTWKTGLSCKIWAPVSSLPNPAQPSLEIPRSCLAYGGNTLGVILQAHPYVENTYLSTPQMTVEVGLPRVSTSWQGDTRFKVFMADTTFPRVTDVNSPIATKSVQPDGTIVLKFEEHYSTDPLGPNPAYPASLMLAPWVDFTIDHESPSIPNRLGTLRWFQGPNCGSGGNGLFQEDIPVGDMSYGENLMYVMDGEVHSFMAHPTSRIMRSMRDLHGVPLPPQYEANGECINVKIEIDWSWPQNDPNNDPEPPPPGVTACQQTVQAGGDIPEIHTIELGANSGTTMLWVNTYQVPDQLIVKYQGTEILDTGCYGTAYLQGCNGICCCYGTGLCSCPLAYSGASSQMTVEVIPNCSGTPNTQWAFSLDCASP